MFKWEIKIGNKPRGLWRPEVKFRIFCEDMKYINDLNISKEYKTEYNTACVDRKYKSCDECKKNNYQNLGFTFYTSSSPKDKGISCPPRALTLGEFFFAYLEWRPGKPDYSDLIEKIRQSIIQPAMDWFQSQLTEAEASEPIEDITISSDCIASITNNKGGEKKPLPTRKVKI